MQSAQQKSKMSPSQTFHQQQQLHLIKRITYKMFIIHVVVNIYYLIKTCNFFLQWLLKNSCAHILWSLSGPNYFTCIPSVHWFNWYNDLWQLQHIVIIKNVRCAEMYKHTHTCMHVSTLHEYTKRANTPVPGASTREGQKPCMHMLLHHQFT